MAEMADVLPNEVIDDVWGNAIRDRTIQRYDNRSTRTSEHSSPGEGDLSYLEDENVLEFYDGAAWVGFIPAGTIVMTGRASAPSGWVLCQGQAISRTTYATLFSAISTTFGSGDGSTTFNVPDLRQRFPLGKAASGTGQTLGDTGGSINHVHSQPNHNHPVNPPNTATTQNGQHDHANSAGSGSSQPSGAGSASGRTSMNGLHGHSVDIAQFNSGNGGNDNTGQANPPFQVVNFMIKA